MLSPVPKGIYVAGQGVRKTRKKSTVLLLTSTPNIEEAKAKCAPPPLHVTDYILLHIGYAILSTPIVSFYPPSGDKMVFVQAFENTQ